VNDRLIHVLHEFEAVGISVLVFVHRSIIG
jgi:hypothetical protein